MRREMFVWCPPTTSSPSRRRTSLTLADAATTGSRMSLVHLAPSRSKCETFTPSFFIRSEMYRRLQLFGSTPNFPNASDNVRDELAASSRRSLVYGLTGMVPLRSGHTFVTSYGVTNRLSDSHARN